jgi:DNA-directed RNA polymerase subunit RPC12/RpoP
MEKETAYECIQCGKKFKSKEELIKYPQGLVCKQCDAELDKKLMESFRFKTKM